MKYIDKQILFKSFLKEWGLKFNQIPFILNYISSYPELTSKLEDFHPLSSEEIKESQLEWVSLVSQFDRDIEKVFFKPYWVPIQIDSYEYFIDLSSHSLPIFSSEYFFFEPYRWYKKYLFKNITEFLSSVDDHSISLQDQLITNDKERWADVDQLFNERNKLGFDGKIALSPIDKYYLFDKNPESSYQLFKDTLEISGINSIGIGLLRNDLEITLNHFDATNNKHKDVTSKIRNIKALTYLIETVGFLKVNSYRLSFNASVDCYAEFEDNILTIRHTDNSLLKELIEKYEFHQIP
jgi:hypothetical protein